MAVSAVRIIPVTTRKELKDYVLFPFKLYRDDPWWVPPLIDARLKHFDRHHNPFFEHAEIQMFRAVRDGETVGTITAIDDQLHPQVWNESVGFFGEFEVIEDYEVARQLLDAARHWLAGRGRQFMRGPMNLHINDECAMLVDGFDGSPVVMMTYNPRYYPEFMERYGLTKVKDVYAFKLDIARYGPNLENLPEQISRVAALARDRYHVQIRKVDMQNLARDVELLKPIHREAWSQNWGALPLSDAEFDYLRAQLQQVLNPDMSYLAFIDGQAVGVFIVLPDFNQVVKHINGRLFPFGWAKFLWYKRKVTGLRVLIMGVLEQHRLKGIESLFYLEASKVAVRRGYEWVEESWILEDNYKVIRGIELMGGERYRTYRFYQIPTA